MPRSSSGPGRLPLTEEIMGSNPIRGTMRLRFIYPQLLMDLNAGASPQAAASEAGSRASR